MSKTSALKIDWVIRPQGQAGVARAKVTDGAGAREVELRFKADDQGLWIEYPTQVLGFDVHAIAQDDGPNQYVLLGRTTSVESAPARLMKPGEEILGSAAGGKKKAPKVKAQMPGKIVRILIEAGGAVTKGQSLMVMEAMKMENEIKAPQDGKIAQIKVSVGQAVESGAELLNYE